MTRMAVGVGTSSFKAPTNFHEPRIWRRKRSLPKQEQKKRIKKKKEDIIETHVLVSSTLVVLFFIYLVRVVVIGEQLNYKWDRFDVEVNRICYDMAWTYADMLTNLFYQGKKKGSY